MGLREWECTVCVCPTKSSRKLIVSYLLRTHNENELLKKRLSTCATKQSSLLKLMRQCFYWGAEFARGPVCQGPSLSGAEMSRNPFSSYGPLFMKIHCFKRCPLSNSNIFDQNFMKLGHIV